VDYLIALAFVLIPAGWALTLLMAAGYLVCAVFVRESRRLFLRLASLCAAGFLCLVWAMALLLMWLAWAPYQG
jgi:hypothetical protein